jgi:hypothetical protein
MNDVLNSTVSGSEFLSENSATFTEPKTFTTEVFTAYPQALGSAAFRNTCRSGKTRLTLVQSESGSRLSVNNTTPSVQQTDHSTLPSTMQKTEQTTAQKLSECLKDTQQKAGFITRLQIALYRLGYYAGTFDGLLGPVLTDAVQRYRIHQLLPQHELIDLALLDALDLELH